MIMAINGLFPPDTTMQVIHATTDQLDTLARLFNQYRIFYELPDNLPASREFIRQNLEQQRSRLLLLLDDEGQASGFAQLYPAICSLTMQDYFYLSDLYIAPTARKSGHARFLMNYLADYGRAEGAQRITLETARSNLIAQYLYESLGYQRDDVYLYYSLPLQS